MNPIVRAALFTPGSQMAWLRTAPASSADVCIFDLEDSVLSSRTVEARGFVREAIRELHTRVPIWVRVNRVGGADFENDVASLPLEHVSALMLPKVEGVDELDKCHMAVARASGRQDLPLVPLIETSSGALASLTIARSSFVFCLAFGRFDLSAELDVDPSEQSNPAMSVARGLVVLASHAAGLPPPLDSPWLKVEDLEGLRKAAETARRDGFGGMLIIHPTHVPTVKSAFRPTNTEITWAQRILTAAEQASLQGRGAFLAGTDMADEATLRRARGILKEVGE